MNAATAAQASPAERKTPSPQNNLATWEVYAPAFARITTLFQSEVYRHVAQLASGRVVDFGCGSAKLAPYLTSADAVTQYVGVDASPLMVQLGQETLEKLTNPHFSVTLMPIEAIEQRDFDFGSCVNSYYAWRHPLNVLKKIRGCLRPGAEFILATPNQNLDMAALMQECRKDLLLQPEFAQFQQCNEQLTLNSQTNFVPMDKLVGQLRSAQFEILDCHSRYFSGGLNFVHTRTPDRVRR